jgi:uncharacterized protein YkwD
MRVNLVRFFSFFLIGYSVSFCSTEVSSSDGFPPQAINYMYSLSELEALASINLYRVSIGLNELEQNNYISYESEEHNDYMIKNNAVNHNDFITRSENIMKVLGAKRVAENIAYNYKTIQGALDAWIKSPRHKKNIEGDFTHFGISIRENAEGKKYYTNIFVKR